MNHKYFSEFNTENFPRVNIKLNENIKSDEDFEYFVNNWLDLYQKKQNYYFIIDTTSTGMINIKYAIKLTNFIKELKQNVIEFYDKQWLEYSIILVSNSFILYLFNFIFNITKPIAPVFLVYDKKNIDLINTECQKLKKNKQLEELDDNYFLEINQILKNKNINYKFLNIK